MIWPLHTQVAAAQTRHNEKKREREGRRGRMQLVYGFGRAEALHVARLAMFDVVNVIFPLLH